MFAPQLRQDSPEVLPGFVAEHPSNRAGLEVAFISRTESPEEHSVAKYACVSPFLVLVEREQIFDGETVFKKRVKAAFDMLFSLIVFRRKPNTRPGVISDDPRERKFGAESLAGLNRGLNDNSLRQRRDDFLDNVAGLWGICGKKAPRNR